MSKRFGRNQKRALRKDIADLQAAIARAKAAHQLDRELIANQRETIQYQHHTLADIAELFGAHFIGLDPATMNNREVAEVVKIPLLARVQAMAPTDLCEAVNRSTCRIAVMKPTQVRAWLDDMRNRQHICIKTPSGEVAYAYTEGAFDGLPRHIVLRKIAEAMAEHLITSPETRKIL